MKHYDYSSQSDVLEPENHGIVAYMVTQNIGVLESGWISVNKTDYLNQDIQVKDNGTWNVWVKDVGGNVASMQVLVQNLVHKENDFPQIEIKSSLQDYQKEYDLIIELKDLDGLKEYCIGKTLKENFTKLEEKSYNLYYTIKENGTYYIYVRDIYDNDYQLSLDIQKIDNQEPVIQNLYYQDGYIYVDAHDYQSGIKAYKLDDNEWQEDSRFMVKENENYIIMVQDMAGNYAQGEIKVGDRSFLIGDDIYELLMQIMIIVGVIILLALIIKMVITNNKKKH